MNKSYILLTAVFTLELKGYEFMHRNEGVFIDSSCADSV